MKLPFLIILFISTQVVLPQSNIEDTLQEFKGNYESIKGIDNQIKYLDSLKKNTKDLDTLFLCNYGLGSIYFKRENKYDLAKKYLFIAERLSKKTNNVSYQAEIYKNIGQLYDGLSKGDSAFFYFEKSLKLSYLSNDNEAISRILSNTAKLYYTENKVDKAIAFYRKSIYYGKRSNRNLCTTYNNLGSLFLGEKIIDSALFYYNKSLLIAIKNNNKSKELRANLNIGITLLEESKNYRKAYKYLSKAEKEAIELNKTKYLYYAQFHLGRYFDLMNQPQKAILYYNKALSNPSAKTDYLKQIEVLKLISSFYRKRKDYQKALVFNEKYHILKDSVFSVQKQKAFDEISTKYEVEKKDNKITLLTKEKELKEVRMNIIIISASFILALLLLLVYFLRIRIKNQKRSQEQKQKLFAQELKTKNALNLIKGQENERKRLAKELHDGLGGQLSGVKSLIQTISPQNLLEKTNIVDKHLTNAIKSLRNISHDLSANFLKNKDFDVLLQQLIKQVFENKNIKTEVSLFPKEKINSLPERYKLNIYRILQESLQNIIKHADANFVSINLTIADEITLLIEDNGKGFETNNKSDGIGIKNIKDRLQSLNGTLHIDSKINNGTTLNIHIPND